MLYIGKMSGWLSDKCCLVVENTEAKEYRCSVLIGFLPSSAGAERLCTLTEAAKGMPYRLLRCELYCQLQLQV
jgi:hypothetical protein